jgi:hypothetical protein
MLDRYIEFTREHQAQLMLDAANQRLVAQTRLHAGADSSAHNVVARVAHYFRGVVARRRVRLDVAEST